MFSLEIICLKINAYKLLIILENLNTFLICQFMDILDYRTT